MIDTVEIEGVTLALHPSPDYLSDQVRATGDFYERDILDEIRSRRPGGTLVDVGAMIGNHTAYLAAFVEHRWIHAWEPVSANRRLLELNTAPFPTVTVHAEALGRRRGRGYIGSPDPGNAGHAMLGHGHEAVNVVQLDAYRLPAVTLLKIDVEGHEAEVLAGARKTIARDRPLIVIEDWGDLLEQVLFTIGYRLVVAWPDQQTALYESA